MSHLTINTTTAESLEALRDYPHVHNHVGQCLKNEHGEECNARSRSHLPRVRPTMSVSNADHLAIVNELREEIRQLEERHDRAAGYVANHLLDRAEAAEAQVAEVVRARNSAMRQSDEERRAKEGNIAALNAALNRAEAAEAEIERLRKGRDWTDAKLCEQTERAEAAEAELAELRAEIERLWGKCSCGTPGLNYEGPQEDCAIHGRPVAEVWDMVAESDRYGSEQRLRAEQAESWLAKLETAAGFGPLERVAKHVQAAAGAGDVDHASRLRAKRVDNMRDMLATSAARVEAPGLTAHLDCEACGAGGVPLRFSDAHQAHFCDWCYERENPQAKVDERPHSHACGVKAHHHGPVCSFDCPTCHGRLP